MALSLVTSCVFFALISTVLSKSSSLSSHEVGPTFQIVPKEQDTTTGNGAVNGFRYCGGPWKALGWRLESCKGDGLCQVPADNIIRVNSIDFIPDHSYSGFTFKINFVDNSTRVLTPVFEKELPDSVAQGEAYTLITGGAAGEKLKGKTMTVQYLLYAAGKNDTVVMCAEADFQVG